MSFSDQKEENSPSVTRKAMIEGNSSKAKKQVVFKMFLIDYYASVFVILKYYTSLQSFEKSNRGIGMN